MPKESKDPNPLLKFVLIYIIIALALFIPAGTIFWLQGWIYIVIAIGFSCSYLIYLKKQDPALLKARTKSKPTESWDKIVTTLASICMIALYIIPGLDAVRFRWSNIPLVINIIGYIGMMIALFLFFLVSRENTFLSTIVEVQKERDHRVITTGPYRLVRHPMYLAVIILYICHCFALGSFLALIPCSGLVIAITVRTYFEDRMLHQQLEGYSEYAQITRYRLLPGIW